MDLSCVAPDLPGTIKGLLQLGGDTLSRVETAANAANSDAQHDLESLTLLPPVRDFGKMLCLGVNYTAHAAEGGNPIPTHPNLFMRAQTAIIADGQPIIRSAASSKLDFEAELAVVIGRRAKHVAREDALGCVAGYSIFNDATFRDYQKRTSQWIMGKNFDSTGPFGPLLVTPDELPEGCDGLSIQSRLNGEIMQDDNTSNMIFGVAETIATITEGMTLEPGDVIAMGTPEGVGFGRTPPVYMKHGDVIEIEIEGIGVLRNPVQDEQA